MAEDGLELKSGRFYPNGWGRVAFIVKTTLRLSCGRLIGFCAFDIDCIVIYAFVHLHSPIGQTGFTERGSIAIRAGGHERM